MRVSMRYPIIILLSITLLIGQFGCATGPEKRPYKRYVLPPLVLPPTPSEEVRAHLGTIGVVSARFLPQVKFQKPMGKGEAAGLMAAEGVLEGVLHSGEAGLAGLLLLPAFGILGASLGAIEGAAKGVSLHKTKEAEHALIHAIAGHTIQETMRDQVLQVAREQTRHRFVLVEEQGPIAVDEEVSYRDLASQSIDTVIEISVLKFGLVGRRDINPPLLFSMTERTRLIRTVDGKVLYVHTLVYEGAWCKFVDWAANHAQPFRQESERCYRSLAEKIVEELFLLYLPKEPKEDQHGSSGQARG